MKRNQFYRYGILAVILAVVTIIACEKQLNKTNPSYPTLDTYFLNSDELLRGLNSVYSSFHSGQLVAREWFFVHDLRSDDVATGGTQLELPRGQILNGNTSPNNAVSERMWNGLYTVIHRANTVIFYSSKVNDNTNLRDRCVAEAKFFRGWAYFELVSLWGPVPVYLEPVTQPDQFQARKSEEVLYNQIIKDLDEAADVLPPSYPASDRGRVTWGAARAMLGRVYMQMGDYSKAREALLEITTSGNYSLTPRYLDNFEEENEFNQESIFEAVFFETSPNQFNWGGASGPTGDDPSAPQGTVRNQEYSPIAWRNLIPANRYLEEFEVPATGAPKEDPRLRFSVYRPGDMFNNGTQAITRENQNGNSSSVRGTEIKVSWRKYTLIYKHGITDRAGGGINHRIIRYAEVLLMLAECENEIFANGGNAVNYLNNVRQRADVQMPNYPLAAYPVGTKDQRTRAIAHEKSVEMGGEQVRNRDILRWRKRGYIPSVIPEPFPQYFKPNKDALLPIPQQEIDNNPELGAGGIAPQNAGY